MKLKTYRAGTMADALVAVKKDLGRDAVILHTRMFKRGGIFGLGARLMVEVTASDSTTIAPSLRIKDRAGAKPAGGAASGNAARSPSKGVTVGAGQDERALIRPTISSGNRNINSGDGVTGSSSRNPTTTAHAASVASSFAAAHAVGQAGIGSRAGGTGAPATSAPLVESKPATTSPTSTPAAGVPMSVHNSRAPLVMDNDQASAMRQVARHAIDPHTGTSHAIQAELAVIRRMVGQVLQGSARAAIAGSGGSAASGSAAGISPALKMSDALVKHYARLIENEVAQETADEIVAHVRDELTPAELADDAVVRQAVLRRLEILLPVSENISAPGPTDDGRPLTIALIGPTGVGKTTTIAKLAAAYRLRHGKRVTLITSDTYRIAAVDQLRTYANIIGVPLRVVMTPAEMKAAVDSSSQSDVVLIDTAGRSPADTARLEELRAFIGVARPHQTHLVLSSVSGETAMVRTLERFSGLNPNLLIFTKLDEAANLGVVVNIARRVNAKLSYVTTGQEVPDDIEPSRADRLARLVLDGKNTP